MPMGGTTNGPETKKQDQPERKANPKKKASGHKPLNMIIESEKKAKETLSTFTMTSTAYQNFAANVAARKMPLWVDSFTQKLDPLWASVVNKRDEMKEFFEDFSAKALTTSGLRDLKKKYGDQYLGLLGNFNQALVGSLAEVQQELDTIDNMIRAEDARRAGGQTPPPKTSGKRTSSTTGNSASSKKPMKKAKAKTPAQQE